MKDRSRLTLENCQIKSLSKLYAVCAAIDTLEAETFIRSGEIKFDNVFVCPDIDLSALYYATKNPTEKLVTGLCMALHVAKWGENSNPKYKKIVAERENLVTIAKGIKPTECRKSKKRKSG